MARPICAIALCVVIGTIIPGDAAAHPHVLPTAQMDLIFDPNQRVAAIHHTWLYDSAYSTFARRDIDTNKDGAISEDELAAFAKNQIDALAEHSYFTTVTTQGGNVDVMAARSYKVTNTDDGRLRLEFIISLKAPTPIDQQFAVELFDPEIFAYFTMAKEGATLVGAPRDCIPVVTGPQPIDLRNTRSIPAIFWDALNNGSKTAARQLVNRITVKCP